MRMTSIDRRRLTTFEKYVEAVGRHVAPDVPPRPSAIQSSILYLQQQFRNEPPQPVVSLILAQEKCNLDPKQSVGDRLEEDAHMRLRDAEQGRSATPKL